MIDEVLRFNASETPSRWVPSPQYDHPRTLARYAEVADYLGIKGKNDSEKLENLIAAIDQLKEKVGIKKTIKDYGIDEKKTSWRVGRYGGSRPSTTSAPAPIRAIRS